MIAHLENIALQQARSDSRLDSNFDSGTDLFAFGDSSPRQRNQDNDLDSVAHTRDVEEYLLMDKWANSRFPSVPDCDSEKATAIESILNEELS